MALISDCLADFCCIMRNQTNVLHATGILIFTFLFSWFFYPGKHVWWIPFILTYWGIKSQKSHGLSIISASNKQFITHLRLYFTFVRDKFILSAPHSHIPYCLLLDIQHASYLQLCSFAIPPSCYCAQRHTWYHRIQDNLDYSHNLLPQYQTISCSRRIFLLSDPGISSASFAIMAQGTKLTLHRRQLSPGFRARPRSKVLFDFHHCGCDRHRRTAKIHNSVHRLDLRFCQLCMFMPKCRSFCWW